MTLGGDWTFHAQTWTGWDRVTRGGEGRHSSVRRSRKERESLAMSGGMGVPMQSRISSLL